ncbi:hypothetical protein GCM10027081_45340 [Cupriavidus yeoncheonensis]
MACGGIEAQLLQGQAGAARIGQYPFHGAEQIIVGQAEIESQGGIGGGWHVAWEASVSVR